MSLACICAKEQALFNKNFILKCFYVENLNLNPEKSNKTAKYQQCQCDRYLDIKVIPSFFLFCNYLLVKKQHIDKAM